MHDHQLFHKKSSIESTYTEIKSKLKTGDIILFRYRKHKNILNRISYWGRTRLIGSMYGHVGIVYRDENGLYAIESTFAGDVCCDRCVNLNKKGLGGVRMIDLDTLIKGYSEEYDGSFAVRFASEAIPNNIFMGNLQKYAHYTYENLKFLFMYAYTDNLFSHWLAKKLVEKYRPLNTPQCMCSGFVYQMLLDCGMVKETEPRLIWPSHYHNGKFDQLTLKPYSDLIVFYFDK